MKSMCQDSRRSSPSVADRSPASCCIRTTSRMAASSISRSRPALSRPAACSSRARSSSGGRSRLPTWSARNGGRPDGHPVAAPAGGCSFWYPGMRLLSPRIVDKIVNNPRASRQGRLALTRGTSGADRETCAGRAPARVADARRDFHHQLSTALVRDNQAVAVEDLAVKGLARTRLARSVHDAGWSSFVAMLEYKARLYGRGFHRIGRFVPTSRTCSACGVTDCPKPLHIRAWQCPSCGVWLDRDINAAVNVAKAAGLAVT